MYNSVFARYYDSLTANVNYPARAKYFDRLIKKVSKGCAGNILLDLACGTGSLSWRFAAMGYQVIGVDASTDMLAAATAKAGETELPEGVAPPLFLCQSMQELDLYGSIDACVCALDSINHLPNFSAVKAVFGGVALFLAPGGVFVFDVNTSHKHKNILADNAFVYKTGDRAICLWQNTYHPKNDRVDVSLDFFTPQGPGLYRRETQQLSERIFTHRQLQGALGAAGLRLLAVYEENTMRLPGKQAQRVVYMAQKLPVDSEGKTHRIGRILSHK
ncbi:MAG: class I SAM-dependent methyltransferase [Oscillospiraceae bacterium]|nr:class I SAM-dependent methyltransferase [Oscillospiraceae bacterium]